MSSWRQLKLFSDRLLELWSLDTVSFAEAVEFDLG